jgi:hypothetical protein
MVIRVGDDTGGNRDCDFGSYEGMATGQFIIHG